MKNSYDSALFELIQQEENRQSTTLNFIASENYASAPVREAVGSVLMNKYAEGYPSKRYYSGCTLVDQVENLAIERCCTLFKADFANVQPHSGSQANFAAYQAFLSPGDTLLGMSLASGGHLTHGHSVNMSGILYKAIAYEVDPQSELIDYEQVARLAQQHKPKLIIAGASAYSRIIDFKRFAAIAHEHGAALMVDMAHIAGLVAAGLHPSPLPYADVVTSTTHKTLRGPRGGIILAREEHAEAIRRAIMPGTQGGPFMNSIAAKAVCFAEAATPAFIAYQEMVVKTASYMATLFADLGYRIVAGGTDNHLFVVDLSHTDHTGRSAELLLEEAGITVSRSCIPYDQKKPWITSGIRIGTPAMVTRGMTLVDAEQIVYIIHTLLQPHTSQQRDYITHEVLTLAKKCAVSI